MENIIISRIDSLGDVVLTLPVAGVLKELYPGSKITFLGSHYTKPLVDASVNIDAFMDWSALRGLPDGERLRAFTSINADVIVHVFPNRDIAKIAAAAAIPVRLGTGRRFYHWLYCNRKVNVARRGSQLHEALLNLKLLVPLGAKTTYSLSEIPPLYGLKRIGPLRDEIKQLLSPDKINLILHPKTKGSAREWGLANFSRLVDLLPVEGFQLFVTGTYEDGKALKGFLQTHRQRVVDLTGRMNLAELISFIHAADGLVAASTGPLHIAAALDKFALGLYAPMRPIHAGRWAPVGKNADYLMLDKNCEDCRKTLECACIQSITPEEVLSRIMGWLETVKSD